MDFVLKTNSLSKKYGRFKALDNVNLTVPKGAIYGLVGKNGAGKTTLIRVICGLQSPTDGDYEIYTVNYKDKNIAKSRKRMGAVVETPSIYLDMTAEDNLKQQCLISGVPDYSQIPEVLKLVGLENTDKKRVRNFSLGMKQRLGIAVALIGNPDFLVLDEPINGLDPQGIIEIRELILKLNREKQITFLISSHILDELSRIATNYGFIDNGTLIKEISADELKANCRKCTVVTVSNIEKFATCLDKENADYEIISDTEAKIFSDVNLSHLVNDLNEFGCELISSNSYKESLEGYFINIVGGVEDE